MRAQLPAQIDKGTGHNETIAALAVVYDGHHFLTAPIDKGFNRLAWLFPYALAATGITVIGLAAAKWTRKPQSEPSEESAPADTGLDERIDDELRNLD